MVDHDRRARRRRAASCWAARAGCRPARPACRRRSAPRSPAPGRCSGTCAWRGSRRARRCRRARCAPPSRAACATRYLSAAALASASGSGLSCGRMTSGPGRSSTCSRFASTPRLGGDAIGRSGKYGPRPRTCPSPVGTVATGWIPLLASQRHAARNPGATRPRPLRPDRGRARAACSAPRSRAAPTAPICYFEFAAVQTASLEDGIVKKATRNVAPGRRRARARRRTQRLRVLRRGHARASRARGAHRARIADARQRRGARRVQRAGPRGARSLPARGVAARDAARRPDRAARARSTRRARADDPRDHAT